MIFKVEKYTNQPGCSSVTLRPSMDSVVAYMIGELHGDPNAFHSYGYTVEKIHQELSKLRENIPTVVKLEKTGYPTFVVSALMV